MLDKLRGLECHLFTMHMCLPEHCCSITLEPMQGCADEAVRRTVVMPTGGALSARAKSKRRTSIASATIASNSANWSPAHKAPISAASIHFDRAAVASTRLWHLRSAALTTWNGACRYANQLPISKCAKD